MCRQHVRAFANGFVQWYKMHSKISCTIRSTHCFCVCGCLFKDIYDRVAKIVAPKQQALAVAELELADQMEKLNSKRTELQVILDKLRGLNDFFAEKSRQKKNLEDEIDNCEKKLDRYR